jgi:7,8-dihydropterin-6-yl-methyl-4-(beta-D-ribofuranosyl)aminobenzene 5'-phosphate synthase
MVMNLLVTMPLLTLAIPFFLLVILQLRFKKGKARVARHRQRTEDHKLRNFGAIKAAEILPLIDFYTNKNSLMGEAAVSYLIKTDERTILFDVGYNSAQRDPSPLLNNMKELGIAIPDFDTVFISHNHPDHVGGMKNMRRRTFSLTNGYIDLSGKAIYTPVPMSYPNSKPLCSERPTVIGKGIASTGTIPNQLFFLGWTLEQSLALNVEGKGIVLIVGCGHPTLPSILERAERLFEEPLFGLVGGLHYPVTGGRDTILGIPIERYVGTGKPPWRPVTMEEVQQNIALLKSKHPRLVALSAHDSCDASLAAFRDAFGTAYRDIRVGEPIAI